MNSNAPLVPHHRSVVGRSDQAASVRARSIQQHASSTGSTSRTQSLTDRQEAATDPDSSSKLSALCKRSPRKRQGKSVEPRQAFQPNGIVVLIKRHRHDEPEEFRPAIAWAEVPDAAVVHNCRRPPERTNGIGWVRWKGGGRSTGSWSRNGETSRPQSPRSFGKRATPASKNSIRVAS